MSKAMRVWLCAVGVLLAWGCGDDAPARCSGVSCDEGSVCDPADGVCKPDGALPDGGEPGTDGGQPCAAGCSGATPVCDASANGGAGACVACTATAGCGGATPVCDVAANGGQGACVACTGSQGCGGSTPVCDTSANGGAGACVACTASAGCTGATPVCDVAANSGAGACVTCSATEGCSGLTPVCDVAANGGQGACVACTASQGCSGATPVCDTSVNGGVGLCVTCTATAGCSGATPVCDTAAGGGQGACVTCTATAGCAGARPVCDPAANGGAGRCLTCKGTDGCSGGTPYCNESAAGGLGVCLACTPTMGCSGGTPVCDVTAAAGIGACVVCTDADGCGGASPFCNAAGNGGRGECLGRAAFTSVQLARVRAAPRNASVSLRVEEVLVTYVKPAVGTDPAGFFLQSEPEGPAVFVAVDPATLTPPPQRGDTVSLTVTQVQTAGGLAQVGSLTNYSRLSIGTSVAPLSQDVTTKTDLVSGLDSYESELIDVTGAEITSPFTSAGSGHLGALIDTAGVTGSLELKLRLPSPLVDTLDISQGCTVTVHDTPLWRLTTTAQVSAWDAADVTVDGCRAPRLLSASATSPTTVVLTFDRNVGGASVLADGTQFTVNPALAVSGAVASGRQVTLTTTAQASGTPYTVTVATTLQDARGVALDAGAAQATFNGYVQPAVLRLNEVNPNMSGGPDLLELYVVSAGLTENIKLVVHGTANPATLITLPSLPVATGDYILVHMDVANGKSETTQKNQCVPGSTGCPLAVDTAWDLYTSATGISVNDRVVNVVAANGTVLDSVAFMNATSVTTSQFLAELQARQAAGDWLPANCNGAPCTGASTPTAKQVSVDWGGLGNTQAHSVYRVGGADTNQASDWAKASGTATFGAPNP